MGVMRASVLSHGAGEVVTALPLPPPPPPRAPTWPARPGQAANMPSGIAGKQTLVGQGLCCVLPGPVPN